MYRSSLDGVRAFCILLTFAHHVPDGPSWINGRMGVDIFFVLSGWLITTLMLEEKAGTGFFSLGAFYIRRVFRIVPLYLFTVVLYGLAAWLIGSSADRQNLTSALPYLITFNREYAPDEAGNLFGHAWTLGIEEKFYLGWPLILAGLAFRGGAALGVAALCCIAVVALALFLSPEQSVQVLRGYFGLFAGVLSAWASFKIVNFGNWLGRPHTADVAASLIVIIVVVSTFFPHAFGWNIAVSLVSIALIGGLWRNGTTWVAGALGLSILAWLGRLTFALYLTHVLVINAVDKALSMIGLISMPVTFLLSYAASVCLAASLHIAIEKPLIRLGRMLANRWKNGRSLGSDPKGGFA